MNNTTTTSVKWTKGHERCCPCSLTSLLDIMSRTFTSISLVPTTYILGVILETIYMPHNNHYLFPVCQHTLESFSTHLCLSIIMWTLLSIFFLNQDRSLCRLCRPGSTIVTICCSWQAPENSNSAARIVFPQTEGWSCHTHSVRPVYTLAASSNSRSSYFQ